MAKLSRNGGNVSPYRSAGVIDEKQQRREHTLEWIAAGLVAFFIFAGVAFYSFSVDVRNVGVLPQKGSSNHRL
jgi:hypothetical protein